MNMAHGRRCYSTSGTYLQNTNGVLFNICENCIFAFCFPLLLFFISFVSHRLYPSPCFWPQYRMMCCTTGRQTETEIHKQITRQIDQEVVELSMQGITAVTSRDHRRNRRQGDGKRVTGVARAKGSEREKQKQVRRRRCS